MLEIVHFVLGPVQTNSYLVADQKTGYSVSIDPASDGHIILEEARKHGWQIKSIWLTHAHFDHLAGTAAIADSSDPKVPVALHPDDLPLWQARGGAQFFGLQIEPGPEPSMDLHHGQILKLGENEFEVRYTPGHTPGHVIFYSPSEKVAFCGDVIFNGSIGRTDLPGGDFNTLIHSIRTQILTLPDETRLLTGHGEETTVGHERMWNYFLR